MLVNKRKNQTRVNKVVLALKRARMEKSISRYKLAQETGLSQSSIVKIEELRQNPTLSTLMEISINLHFNLPLAIKENYPDDFENVEDEFLGGSPVFDMVIDDLKKLSEEDLKVAHKILLALAERNKS